MKIVYEFLISVMRNAGLSHVHLIPLSFDHSQLEVPPLFRKPRIISRLQNLNGRHTLRIILKY